jgi:hypothetical protein
MIKKAQGLTANQLVGRNQLQQRQTGAAGNAPGRLGVGFGSIGFTITTIAGSSVERQLVLPTIARKIKGFAFAPSSASLFNPNDFVKLELDNQVFVENHNAISLTQQGELWYYPYERAYFNNSVFKISVTSGVNENVQFIVYYES